VARNIYIIYIMHTNFISYPFVKFLAEEKEVREPVKHNSWIFIIFNTFFSTGYETNKEKET
jgi:hypothetical protein